MQAATRSRPALSLKLLSFCVAAALAHPVAATWDIVPEVSLYAETDDNILVSPDDEESASRTAVEALVTMTNFSQRGRFYVQPAVASDAYSGEASIFETDDKFLELGGEYAWRTSDANFRTLYSREGILDSEFIDIGPEDDIIVGPDTGRLEFISSQRELMDLGAEMNFNLNARSFLALGVGYQDVKYGDGQSTYRTNYDDTTFEIGLGRRLQQTRSIGVNAVVSSFAADRNDNTTDSTGIEVVYTHAFDPTWTLDLRAGWLESDYGFVEPGGPRIEDTATNTLFGATLRKRTQRMQWDVGLTHGVQPNGVGYVVVRDALRAFMRRQLTQYVTAQLGATISKTKAVDEVRPQDERDFSRVAAGLEWTIKRNLILTTAYTRTTQQFVNEGGDATANAITVGITFRGRPRAGNEQL